MNCVYMFLTVFIWVLALGAITIVLAAMFDWTELPEPTEEEQVFPVQAVLYDHNGKPVFVNDLEKVGVKHDRP